MIDKQKDNNTANPFAAMEEKVLAFWDKAKTFEQSLDKVAPRGDYVFYDGPPFATGTPHYGHIVASVMKDIVPRYETMRGYHVARRWGWDCHGLPIENIVEKELGTKTKKDIEALGVAKFNDLCRTRVLTYVDVWKQVIRRLGRWADMENAYKTMDLDFMDSIWWGFKQLWDKGLIYQDYRSMHICPRCETTLSQSEVTEGYRDIKDLSAIVKFELADEPGTYILAWTTTPWTLIGNVALAVGEGIDYVKVKSEEINYILAKARLADVFKDKTAKVLEEFKGSALVGKSYKPLFSYYASDSSLENRENGWKIYGADFVTTDEGTGVVHIAPAFGEDDMNLGKAQHLPFVQHVGYDGLIKSEAKDFAGLSVKPLADHMGTDIEIIKYLSGQGSLFDKAKYEHSYPHCWRCDTPLINYATSSWFVKVSAIKPLLLEKAKDIAWSPVHLKEGRFGNWLEGARDWSISRQRFWASAIPIWECACGERKVMSGVKELEELSGQKIDDIHKDKVDPITFPCPACRGEMKRIPDVLDCWFESGSMPFAQEHYPFENKERFEANFPAQFIAEGVDQTRAWFYYLHVIAGGIFGKASYRNVMVNGIVLAEDGKKMSKRLNNYPDPSLVIEKYGADALRAYLAASAVMQAENLNFFEKGVEEALRQNVMTLWNVYRFYSPFASEYDGRDISSGNVLDAWIIAKLKMLVADVSVAMEGYNLPKAMRPITEFINDLSTWYLRRSRDRFKSEDTEDKQAALATTRFVLITLAKVMAPFLPFIAENLWQEVSGHGFKDKDQSVHLEAWPELGGQREADKKFLADMEVIRRAAEIGLAERDKAGIKIRQMLAKIEFKGAADPGEAYSSILSDELNIRQIIWQAGGNNLEAVLDTAITPELLQEGMKRELIRAINNQRKLFSLSPFDKVSIFYRCDSQMLRDIIIAFKLEIEKSVVAEQIIEVAAEVDLSPISINGESLFIRIEKVL